MNPLKRKADLLYSKHIRSIGYCEAHGHEIPCSPRLETAHIISRRYAWTRTYIDQETGARNAVCLCSAHHRFFTSRPVEWGEWVLDNIGPDVYDLLKKRSLRREKFDWESELARLEEL